MMVWFRILWVAYNLGLFKTNKIDKSFPTSLLDPAHNAAQGGSDIVHLSWHRTHRGAIVRCKKKKNASAWF